MTIERRIQITTVVLVLFVLAAISTLFWSSRQVEHGIKRVETTSQVVRGAFMLKTLMDDYLDHGSERVLRQWDKLNKTLGQLLDYEVISESIERPLLEDLKKVYRSVNYLYPRVAEMRASIDQNQDLKTKKMLTNLMSLQLEQLVIAANNLSEATQLLTLNRRYFVQQLIVALGISAVLIILINIYLIRKSVVRPLKLLSIGVDRIGTGNFDRVTEIRSDDEVGKLSQAFDTMVARLGERDTALTKARDELELRVEERTAELTLANERLILEIEERKRAEEGITAERQRLYDVLETLPVYVCLLDSDYRMPFANRYFRETFAEPLGRRCHDFLFNLTVPCEICETYTVMKTREPHHWYWTGPNGRNYDIYDFPFFEADGSMLILEMGIDITDRRRAEQDLRESEERFRGIFEQGQLGVEILGLNGQFEMTNPMFQQLLGYSQGEVAKLTFEDVTHPDDLETEYELNQRLLREEMPYFELDKRYIRKDGRVTWANLTKSLLRDQDGTPTSFLSMIQDINERKKMEELLRRRAEELARSNEDLQQFAYVASHDLQEPLRNVASCLQLLEKKYKNNLDAKADQLIHYAVESSVRMKALIQDLLAYSRVVTKGSPPQRVDCEQILDQTVKNLRSAISESGAVIIHDPLPTVLADDAQLSQVFQNLIGNGIKFRREEHPQIHVSAVKNNKEWIFSVKDNGIGIESRHLHRIFMIFQRLHKRSQYGGTGIGLAIVKKVVERHHGRVWAESQFGNGTTFYFTIPEKGTRT
jgi:PAS domain S-box-containing protein